MSSLRRPQIAGSKTNSCLVSQRRNASLLRRPNRPYQFTQLVVLSDGSTYTQRTTSPLPVYRSTKDTKNHILWQPSSSTLRNAESDQAGRLKAFRKRFGRGWDAEIPEGEETEAKNDKGVRAAGKQKEETKAKLHTVESNEQEESLMDLISGAGFDDSSKGQKKS